LAGDQIALGQHLAQAITLTSAGSTNTASHATIVYIRHIACAAIGVLPVVDEADVAIASGGIIGADDFNPLPTGVRLIF